MESAKVSAKGVQLKHPLDPLSAAEIAVAISTVRSAGATPEVRDGMRFSEVVLNEPEKNVVALADAYFFPPFQPSLLSKSKGGPVIPRQLPPRQARLVVYNKRSNETSVWIVELREVHAAARGGHHKGKVISCDVVPDVQPPMSDMFRQLADIIVLEGWLLCRLSDGRERAYGPLWETTWDGYLVQISAPNHSLIDVGICRTVMRRWRVTEIFPVN